MEFDYYHMETGEKFEEYFRFVRQVAMEDYELCEKAQENLTKGVYREGILNPEKENGVSCECLSRDLSRSAVRLTRASLPRPGLRTRMPAARRG
jgi:hypothetical protein